MIVSKCYPFPRKGSPVIDRKGSPMIDRDNFYLICICRQFFLLHRLNTEYGVGEDLSFTDNINFLQYKVFFAAIKFFCGQFLIGYNIYNV